ncbi:MAG: hypothetical protein Q8L66_00255 [Caulobacter sp.]|nr:hypothetical protein [Caulobacter sp.]
MRPFSAPALALAAILALPVAAPAKAGDNPLTREALLATLKGDNVWCSGWRERDQSCEDIAFTDLLSGDKVRQVSRYRMSDDPDLQMVIRETVIVEGAALCSTFHFEDLEIVVLMDDDPAPPEQAAPLLGMLAEAMASLEGKKACEAYVRDEATGELHATVTLDGEPAPEFDSIYRLITPDTRILLRPMFEDIKEPDVV